MTEDTEMDTFFKSRNSGNKMKSQQMELMTV